MARRKRVPHKPDAFQSHGGRAAVAIAERGKIIAVCFVLLVVVFAITFAVLHSQASEEENAWAAFYRARGNSARLRRALEAYGSSPARPHMLMAIARTYMAPSAEERFPAPEETKDESTEERAARLRRAETARKARLRRAERALGELTDDYPDHFYNMLGLNLLGLVLEEQGRYDKRKFEEAATVLERALEKAPKTLDPKIRYDIGRNYVLAGKPAGNEWRNAHDIPKAARLLLEKAAGATRQVRIRPQPYRFPVWVEADWIGNAKYLHAQIGPGERAIPVPKKRAPAPRPTPKKPARKGPARKGPARKGPAQP
ncbi:MAG: hypothetical protein ACYSU0_21975, partial [Planctomycetota bacterium]